MNGNSVIEMYTTLFGWMMYNRVWDILNDTGLAYVPFILLFLINYRRLKVRGHHVGVKEFAATLRIELVIAMLVLMLFTLPVVPVSVGNISSTRVSVECGATTSTVTPGTDPSTYSSSGAFASLGGTSFNVPVGWALWQSVTGGISAAAVAGIPCSGDLRGFQLAVGDQVVQSPAVRRELSDFVQQCYGPAVALIQQDPLGFSHSPSLSSSDMSFMGSSAMLAHPLYNTPISSPRPDFPYDATRDDGYGNNGMGHPTCAQWWLGDSTNAGLRSRMVGEIDPAVLTQAKNATAGGMRSVFSGGATDAQIEDDILHSMTVVSDRQPLEEGAALNGDYAKNTADSSSGGQGSTFLGGIAGIVGSAFSGFEHYPKMMMVREALPIAKAFLVMTLILLMPFIIVLSGYNIAVIATLAVAFLGLQMYDLLWAIAYWMDNMLVKTLLSTASFFGWLAHPQTTAAMDFVTSVLCVVMPLVWLAMLGWAGYQTFDFVSNATGNLINPAGSAGAKGGAKVAKAISQ